MTGTKKKGANFGGKWVSVEDMMGSGSQSEASWHQGVLKER